MHFLLFDCSSLLGFLWEWRTWKSYRERQVEVFKVGLILLIAAQVWRKLALLEESHMHSIGSCCLSVPSPLHLISCTPNLCGSEFSLPSFCFIAFHFFYTGRYTVTVLFLSHYLIEWGTEPKYGKKKKCIDFV